ncbi:O-methyltransferase aurJ [Zalerion maritima]|uniref:O-methyltransferase aurJ n=1 Tax=Zalerion maritima TaxID=339359 RepID=A0AAD5RKL1_9PEZI|nr:O-methyltransferase aurJ [Zalerion maritima]
MDTVHPVPGENEGPFTEAILRVRGLTMMQTFNSRETGLADWQHLLNKAWRSEKDGLGVKLVIKGVKKPFGSTMGILEVAVESTGDASDCLNGSLLVDGKQGIDLASR